MVTTLKDIAKIAKVSTATISKVINGKTNDISKETIEKVEKIIKQERYLPNAIARAMKTNRSYIIGLLVPDIRNPFFTEIARGAEDLAYELGYSLFLCNTDDDIKKETKYLESLYELRVDGIIVAGSLERNEEKESKYKIDLPFIAIDREVYYHDISSYITTDDYNSSKRLVEELYRKGYRSYLYLGGPKTNSVSQNRYKGTTDGLENKENVFIESAFDSFTIEAGYKHIQKINNIKQFDIIICGNDLIAIGVINALNKNNIKIPKEISVVGFDDIELASSFIPKLSTVKQPTYKIGSESVLLIDKIMNGDKIKQHHIFSQTLIFRETTK